MIFGWGEGKQGPYGFSFGFQSRTSKILPGLVKGGGGSGLGPGRAGPDEEGGRVRGPRLVEAHAVAT